MLTVDTLSMLVPDSVCTYLQYCDIHTRNTVEWPSLASSVPTIRSIKEPSLHVGLQITVCVCMCVCMCCISPQSSL